MMLTALVLFGLSIVVLNLLLLIFNSSLVSLIALQHLLVVPLLFHPQIHRRALQVTTSHITTRLRQDMHLRATLIFCFLDGEWFLRWPVVPILKVTIELFCNTVNSDILGPKLLVYVFFLTV